MSTATRVQCPICNVMIEASGEAAVNRHIDECLTLQCLREEGSSTPTTNHNDSDISNEQSEDMSLIQALMLGEENMVETTSAYTGPQVTCPYPACGQALDTYDFPSHAQNFHSSCNQQLACPICFLETGELFSPNENTNLLSHLNQTHRDAAELRKAIMESERAFLNQQRGFVELPTTIGKGYMAHTLDKDLEQECIICTDEFTKGDTVARLECFCVFHQECIDGWFKKSEKRLCPVHRDEENKAAATT